jgi:hypothetical protein
MKTGISTEMNSPYQFLTGFGGGTLDQKMGALGLVASITGMLGGAMSGYFGVQSEKLKLQGQRSSLEFHSKMSALNADMLEQQAWLVYEQGQRQSGMATLKAGQVKSTARSMMASNNLALGSGTTAEVQASNELMKEVERLSLNAETVRAVEATRMQKVGMQSNASLQQVSADNIGRTARGMSGWTSASASLLSGFGSVANSWGASRKYSFLKAK